MGKSFRTSGTLQDGMQGVLVTCFRNCEAKCTKDIYYLLNRVIEQQYTDTNASTADSRTFEEQLKEEVADLRDRTQKPFLAVDPGLQSMVFIQIDPSKLPPSLATNASVTLVERLFEMATTSGLKSRFCQRILPVQQLCHARMEEVLRVAGQLIKSSFSNDTPVEYAVVFEQRLNHSLDRETVVKAVAELVGPRHRVNLSSPDWAILVQVFKNWCALAIVPGYTRYRRYNIQLVKNGADN